MEARAKFRAGMQSAVMPVVTAALDYVLPPRCPGCGTVVDQNHRFCAECWGGLTFLGDPCCACCGVPFDLPQGEGALCAACIAHPPVFTTARAVLAYGEHARTVAIRLKYGRRLGLARLMADHMARRLPTGAGGPDWLIVPVPLYRWRLWGRGFNQAALLAAHLSRTSGITADLFTLLRHRSTKPLRQMNGAERARTVRGAFALDAKRAKAIKGRHIILIDDIHTSGATASACARVLNAGDAASVHLLCWARVLRGADGAD